MTLEKKYTLNEDVKYNVIEGEALVLDLNTGRHFSANGIGTQILDMIAHGRSVEDVVELLGKDYDVDGTVLRRDVGQTIKKLLSEKIIIKA